jgi:hypothetical protein
MAKGRHVRNRSAGFPGAVKWALAISNVALGLASTPLPGFAQAQPSIPPIVSLPTPSVASSTTPYRFNIPAQPLDSALEHYAATSGLPVIFDGSMVAGRMSTPLQGTYPAELALRRLLEGTGLTVDYADAAQADVFVLKAADTDTQPMPAAAVSDTRESDSPLHGHYDGLVQTRLWDAFCNIPSIVPGDYKAAVQFNVDPAGRLAEVRLLRSTGDDKRDGQIKLTLEHIQLDEPPPADMVQPIDMVIQPAQSGQQCRSRP